MGPVGAADPVRRWEARADIGRSGTEAASLRLSSTGRGLRRRWRELLRWSASREMTVEERMWLGGLGGARVDDVRELRGGGLRGLREVEAAAVGSAGGDGAVADYNVVESEIAFG